MLKLLGFEGYRLLECDFSEERVASTTSIDVCILLSFNTSNS